MSRIYRLFATLLAATLLLAACGDQPTAEAPEATSAPAEESEENVDDSEAAAEDQMEDAEPIDIKIDVVEQIPGGFPAYNLPTDRLEILEDRGDTVLVRHRFGETEVPKNPQRVFTDAATLPVALTLDLPIVASYYWDGIQRIPTWEEQTEEVELIPSEDYSYNFEFLLAQDPDLILAFSHIIYGSAEQETVYENLSAIAPTIVLFNDPAELWPQATNELAQIFELSDEEAARLENAGTTIAESCEPLRKTIGDDTVMVLQPIDEEIWVIGPGWMDGGNFLPYSVTSHFYYFCGLNPPENLFDLVGTESSPISQELIPEIQADYLFFYTYGDVDTDDILDNPLWQTIPAFQKDQVYFSESVFGVSYDMTMVAIQDMVNLVTSENE
ncbi:MAG: ABC transporter substrate-binding protein [Chloroflexota bacterium]